jgi:hypothetical protein
MMLAPVASLSDEEMCNNRSPQKVNLGKGKKHRLPRYKRKYGPTYDNTVEPTKLRYLISSNKCGCSCKCFHPFNASSQLFDQWSKERRLMAQMTKLEKDQHVFWSVEQVFNDFQCPIFSWCSPIPIELFPFRLCPVSLALSGLWHHEGRCC